MIILVDADRADGAAGIGVRTNERGVTPLGGFNKLQPADVIFFGSNGPNSKGSQIFHTGIYVGNGWFIQSSDRGVALAQLTGWYKQKFAWGRRPLREAGLEP